MTHGEMTDANNLMNPQHCGSDLAHIHIQNQINLETGFECRIIFCVTVKMWAYSPQSRRNRFFKYNFGEKGYTPLSNVYQIWLGEEVRPLHPHSKFHHCVLKNVGLQPPKSPKLVFFGINLPKRGMPLKRFLQNLAWGRESQVCTLMPNFIVVTFRPAAPSSTAIVGFNISLGT